MAGTLLGCGHSLRRVAQSQIYFERCYAADFDPRVPLAEKHACWTAWREHYTPGQTPDRVGYCEQRIDAIEHGESVPRLPGLPEAAMGPRRATPILAVSSEEAIAEPQLASLDHEDDLPARTRRARRPPPLPRTSNVICAQRACEPVWRACVDSCPPGNDPCETACEVELQGCARGCF